jgi:hypothetical protein
MVAVEPLIVTPEAVELMYEPPKVMVLALPLSQLSSPLVSWLVYSTVELEVLVVVVDVVSLDVVVELEAVLFVDEVLVVLVVSVVLVVEVVELSDVVVEKERIVYLICFKCIVKRLD